jgi:hypothetical protein
MPSRSIRCAAAWIPHEFSGLGERRIRNLSPAPPTRMDAPTKVGFAQRPLRTLQLKKIERKNREENREGRLHGEAGQGLF